MQMVTEMQQYQAGVETGAATPLTALESIERASVDIQVTTAHRFPRSIDRFKKIAMSMATLDEETAESCLYRRPVGKGKDGRETFAEGMSIRMAEIVGACYGNLRVAARIIEQSERQVVAQGVAHDLESNFASTSEVIESTVDSKGRPYSERMRVVVAKAALAKARRDATFQVVPRALAKPVELACKSLLFGNAQSISKRRERVTLWINMLGIDAKRVWAALDVGGPDDLTMEHLETLTGLRTALQSGEITLDEAFPELPKQSRFETNAQQQEKPASPLGDAQVKGPTPKVGDQGVADALAASGAPITVDDIKAWCKATNQPYMPDMIVKNIAGVAQMVADWIASK